MVVSVFNIIIIILIIGTLLLILFLINFYRDPKRNVPRGNNIVSPADGTVTDIFKTKQNKVKINKGILGKIESLTKDVAKECLIISIFMSPFDVHVNRAPIDGHVQLIKYKKGNFFAAYNFQKSLNNEKNEIIISNRKIGKIKVIQVAGFLARRIICTLNKNQKINKGQRIGKIVLGSQVTLIIPSKKTELKVRKKQKVEGGVTIIADIK